MEFYYASSLKQESEGRHVPPMGHIIPTPNQPVFLFYSLMLYVYISKEEVNINFIVLIRPGIVPMIYDIQGENTNHYSKHAILKILTRT